MILSCYLNYHDDSLSSSAPSLPDDTPFSPNSHNLTQLGQSLVWGLAGGIDPAAIRINVEWM